MTQRATGGETYMQPHATIISGNLQSHQTTLMVMEESRRYTSTSP